MVIPESKLRKNIIILVLIIGLSVGYSTARDNGKFGACAVAIEGIADITKLGYHTPQSSLQPVILNKPGHITHHVSDWTYGGELYKAYQDPAQFNQSPYPFRVIEISMTFYIHQAGRIYVSGDIEHVDHSQPNRPFPGSIIALTQHYEIEIPTGGYYKICIPLEKPVMVNGPYFVGFYVDLEDTYQRIDPAIGPTTGDYYNYNVWDKDIGYINLHDNDYYNFPGSLCLYSSGFPGGSNNSTSRNTNDPAPAIVLLSPDRKTVSPGIIKLWAADISGSKIIESVTFEYKESGENWKTIGHDTNGLSNLRNGLDPVSNNDCFSYDWDCRNVPTGSYRIRAMVIDSLGRVDIDSQIVTIQPPMPREYSDIGQSNPDVKHSSTKRFKNTTGIKICGPYAGALAIQSLYNKGHSNLYREGDTYLTFESILQRLSESMRTEKNNGTYDENFYLGLNRYILTHDNNVKLNVYHTPKSMDLSDLHNNGNVLVLAVSGDVGLFLFVDKIDQSNKITVIHPADGKRIETVIQNGVSGLELHFDDNRYSIDKVFALSGRAIRNLRVELDTDGIK